MIEDRRHQREIVALAPDEVFAVFEGGLRRTFNDMLRLANVDPVISKALIGHLTDEMRDHYSTVRLDEKRAAVASALRLLPGKGGSADNSADVRNPANDTAAADTAKAAK